MSENDESKGCWFGCVGQLLFYGLWVFGVFRGFNHDTTRGVVAIFVPPYAWYKSAAVLWEEPKSKWTEEERINLQHFIQAGEYSQMATKMMNVPGSLPEDTKERGVLLSTYDDPLNFSESGRWGRILSSNESHKRMGLYADC